MSRHFDVIVAGGGHAGIEAAWAAARMGAETAMITMSREAIGRMSCNPAIGGVGKGQIVREIDALGGVMGLATDRAGIQFRLLNRSKGPAVWAPRAQADRHEYPAIVQSLLGEARSLAVIEGVVETIGTRPGGTVVAATLERCADAGTGDVSSHPRWRTEGRSEPLASRSRLIRDHSRWRESSRAADGPADVVQRPRVHSITLQDGRVFTMDALILTTGTFLRGLMHCGSRQTEGGRAGEASATGLSATLQALGFTLGRLKTGTPPRVHRDSVDYDECEVQEGDDVPTPFSFLTDRIAQPQVRCWITWTNDSVHELIHANLHRAPMYSGQIQSRGPRYCPSIEDKVVRFADKSRHQVFLEPEGYDNERIYCNGISTSLPQDVQDVMVMQIPGLRRARILQHGYAVEYDYVPTHQTKATLESKLVRGLFFAGQINGTSGYEEAAGQGIMAGINAARLLRGGDPVILGRDEAYIGVMIDDLITRPPNEPYRMFTSRAEYRLRLRADNADRRLTPLGRSLGCVDDRRWHRYESQCHELEALHALAAAASIHGMPLGTWMRRPEADLAGLAQALARLTPRTFSADTLWRALVDSKYSGYAERQDRQIERFRRLESLAIPESLDYHAMPELRYEARENFIRVEPRSLGQAARVSGITPADITILWIYLSGRRPMPTASRPGLAASPSS